MAKLLFVVHRYAPFPGGSEYYVQNMAEEALKRGHDVTVLAHEHQGDLNGVKVTNDYNRLLEKWDLVIVHGGDVISQNIVHMNAYVINAINPVCYMIIKPSDTAACVNGLKWHQYISYSTSMDIEHIKKHGQFQKARRIRHGVVPKTTIMGDDAKPFGGMVDGLTHYVSAGGFYPHKAMVPLAKAWEELMPHTHILHLFGYGEGERPPETHKVRVHFGLPKEEVMTAIFRADGYIMNSYEEGFGLVLLEAMMNKTPWYARAGSGAATDMSSYGSIYLEEKDVINSILHMEHYVTKEELQFHIDLAFDFVMANHTITQTVNDIEDILNE